MSQAGLEASALAIERFGSVELWTMQLGPVNAISAEMLDAFQSALDAAEADGQVSAVVLASRMKVFSAGADATWMAEAVETLGLVGLLESFKTTMDWFRAICLRLRNAPFLVIAAVEGHALAGGLELAAACDLRFCADSNRVRLGMPEMELFGCLPTGGGGAQFLARLLGPSRALEFMLNAKPISPASGFQVGLVDRLCPAGQVQEESLSFAREVAERAGRIGVHAAKGAVFGGAEVPLASAMVLDSSLHWDNMRRGNFLAGVEKFTAQFASKSAR